MNLSDALANLDKPTIAKQSKSRPLTPAEITAWALGHGYSLVRNNLTRVLPNKRVHRLILNDLKVRLEVRVDYESGGHSWIRLRSGYYRDLRISADGTELEGLSR